MTFMGRVDEKLRRKGGEKVQQTKTQTKLQKGVCVGGESEQDKEATPS